MNIKTIKTHSMSWIDIRKPGEKEIEYLRNNFHFHPLDLEDCIDPGRRPKIDEYNDYLFLVLKFPKYFKKKKETQVCNLNIFIGNNYLVTVHSGEILPLKKLFKDLNLHDELRKKYLNKVPAFLLYYIINQILDDCFRMLDHISEKIDEIEKQIYKGKEKAMVEEISMVTREIIDYRKIIEPQKEALKNLKNINSYFIPKRLKIYFEDINEQVEKIWGLLDGQRDIIESLQETNDSLLSDKIGETMRVLTVLSMIMFPLSIVIGVYAQNVKYAPFIEYPYTFWTFIAILLIVIIGAIVYLWKKHRL